jgi:hypothetical protein
MTGWAELPRLRRASLDGLGIERVFTPQRHSSM